MFLDKSFIEIATQITLKLKIITRITRHAWDGQGMGIGMGRVDWRRFGWNVWGMTLW